VEFVGSVGGSISAVVVSNTTAYIGKGAALVVLDVSDPLEPVQLSRLLLPNLIKHIQVVDDLVYTTNGHSGLHIIDVQDPSDPVLLGSYDTPGAAVEVLVLDGRAYIADGNDGMQILDVSNPAAPQLLGTYDTDSFAENVLWVDPVIYLGYGYHGLHILDVENPSTPLLLGHYPDMTAEEIQVDGGFAYLVGRDFGIGIFDVRDPINPTLVNTYRGSVESASGLRVRDGLAYVITHGTLVTIDVSEPTNISELDSLYVSISADLSLSGNLVYVAGYRGTLHIINISKPTDIKHTGQYSTLGIVSTLEVADNIAYVGGDGQGLHVLDISDPTKPSYLTNADSSKYVYDLAIKDEYLYLASGSLGMQIFDVSTPISPTLVGGFTRGVTSIELHDDLAYVYSGGEMLILDISDPVSPTLRSSYPGVFEITIAEGRAYGTEYTGFQIIDVSNPDDPQMLGRYETSDNLPGKYRDIAVVGDFVYLTDGSNDKLQIVDVSDPTAPVLWDTYDSFDGYVHIWGDYAFISSGSGLRRMNIFDVSDPSILKPRSAYSLPYGYYDLQIVNDLIYVADSFGGLQILRLNPNRFPPDLYLMLAAWDSTVK
jgi:hypothetical protein